MKYSGIALLFLGLLAFSFKSNTNNDSSDCSTYFPITIGMEWTMKNMDKKGKETSRNTIKVLDTKPIDGGIAYVMQGLYKIDGKDEVNEMNFEYQCVNNTLKLNMDQFIPAEMLENESMTFEVDTDGMALPENLEAGQKLPDANLKVIAKIEGTGMTMTTNITVTDRLIEKFEDVTTEAGTYSCAKLSSKTNVKMAFMSASSSSIQWISPEVGIVKTEEYDKKGKLESSSELVEFKK